MFPARKLFWSRKTVVAIDGTVIIPCFKLENKGATLREISGQRDFQESWNVPQEYDERCCYSECI